MIMKEIREHDYKYWQNYFDATFHREIHYYRKLINYKINRGEVIFDKKLVGKKSKCLGKFWHQPIEYYVR